MATCSEASQIHADLQRSHGGIELCAQEVCQREAAVRAAQDQRAALIEMGHALACQIVHDHDTAAVGLALEALAVELREQLARVDGAAEQLSRLAQDACPGVHIIRTVVAVHHGDGAAVGVVTRSISG